MILYGEQAVLRTGALQPPLPLQVEVVARVQGVVVVPELQGEECVLAPGDVGVHVHFVLFVRQVGEPFATDAVEVHLGSGGQVNVPGQGGERGGGTFSSSRLENIKLAKKEHNTYVFF